MPQPGVLFCFPMRYVSPRGVCPDNESLADLVASSGVFRMSASGRWRSRRHGRRTSHLMRILEAAGNTALWGGRRPSIAVSKHGGSRKSTAGARSADIARLRKEKHWPRAAEIIGDSGPVQYFRSLKTSSTEENAVPIAVESRGATSKACDSGKGCKP